MDNLMRDKLIELVHDLLWDDEDPQRASMIIDCADEYVESMKSQWIPVSERLSEDTCGCLVTVKFGNGLKIVLPSIYTKYDPKETFSIGGSGHIVEAWEPYPEPYQGGE